MNEGQSVDQCRHGSLPSVLALSVFAAAVVVAMRISSASRIEFQRTYDEVSDACTQHYHEFWHWRGPQGDEWLPRLEKVTHFWECTTETCPNDGAPCERPRPHQKWGPQGWIHDHSL
jgi:hypothetical protein